MCLLAFTKIARRWRSGLSVCAQMKMRIQRASTGAVGVRVASLNQMLCLCAFSVLCIIANAAMCVAADSYPSPVLSGGS